MPVYTYECTQCQHNQTVTHGVYEHPKLACESCGGLMKRQLNREVRVLLKQDVHPEQESGASAVSCTNPSHEHEPSSSGKGCHWDDIDRIVREIESKPDPDSK